MMTPGNATAALTSDLWSARGHMIRTLRKSKGEIPSIGLFDLNREIPMRYANV
ncbi:MAG: hypothetical protein ACR2IE_00720 [Candidatus Sumerlaeaceae bacterium]